MNLFICAYMNMYIKTLLATITAIHVYINIKLQPLLYVLIPYLEMNCFTYYGTVHVGDVSVIEFKNGSSHRQGK